MAHDDVLVFRVWSDSLTEQVISEPGAYRCMCVELEVGIMEVWIHRYRFTVAHGQVFGLAVASIMGSGMLDAQGITSISTVSSAAVGAGSEDDVGSSAISHDAACARAFK